MKLLGLSPSGHAVRWVLYDRTYDRVYLGGVARLESEHAACRCLALESWMLQVLDQYSRLPGIQEVVVEQNEAELPELGAIVRRRCQPWQLKVTELATPTIRSRVVGDKAATDEVLKAYLELRYKLVLDKLDVASALATVLAWTPSARFNFFGLRR